MHYAIIPETGHPKYYVTMYEQTHSISAKEMRKFYFRNTAVHVNKEIARYTKQ